MQIKYRLYIDETGNSDLGSSEDINHRYLSLTGVVFLLSDIENKYYRELEQLKSDFFGSHPDDPIVLHRKELVNKKHPFVILRDSNTEERFNERLLNIISGWNYKIITVTIDKLLHNEQYTTWKYDPYHYCLKVMLERYVRLLMSEENSVGDVMIESRGRKEDMRLKKSFTKVWEEGSEFIKADLFQKVLTSKELKVKPKTANITGLQIADLLAHPASKSAICSHNKTPIPDNFGGKIIKIIEANKFYRSGKGMIEGWGRKWLP